MAPVIFTAVCDRCKTPTRWEQRRCRCGDQARRPQRPMPDMRPEGGGVTQPGSAGGRFTIWDEMLPEESLIEMMERVRPEAMFAARVEMDLEHVDDCSIPDCTGAYDDRHRRRRRRRAEATS